MRAASLENLFQSSPTIDNRDKSVYPVSIKARVPTSLVWIAKADQIVWIRGLIQAFASHNIGRML